MARPTRGATPALSSASRPLGETYTVPKPGEGPWWYVQPAPLFSVLGPLLLPQGIFGVITTLEVGSSDSGSAS